jgi:hypothetical protein
VKHLLLRTGAIVLLFALLSLPLAKVGDPHNPAFAARGAHRDVDIAVVGDSRAHVGISPTKLHELLPEASAFNFAVDGTDTLHHWDFVLRGLLGEGRKPSLILWAPNPLGFNDARQSNRLEQLVGADLWSLKQAGVPLELLLDVATMRWFPPYRHRPLVAAQIGERTEGAGKKLLRVQEKLLHLDYDPPPPSREYLPQPDGHEPFRVITWEDRFHRGEKGYESDYAALGKMDWHLGLARQLLRRAREAGVLVVVLDLPVSPYFRAHFSTDPRHRAWQQAMARISAEEGALFLDHEGRYGDDHAFGDPGHMTDLTSYAYSSWLAGQLASEPRVRAALRGLEPSQGSKDNAL